METGLTRCKEVWMCGFQGTQNPIRFPVTMAKGIHLFPYRTQKLSLSAPMVLGWRRPGRVGRCRIPQRKASDECLGLFLCVSGEILLPAHLRRSQRTYLVRIFPAARSAGCRKNHLEGYRQVLCANSFTSLAELSLHRAGKPALNYLVAEDRERVKGGEAACEALDVNSVFCYQPASSSCISMYFMLMYFFPPHWVPAT